ncbi:MAG: hypothetical protein E7355_00915 [Clostridiales bacterium]|nr:hypothetical protein [Clostridiales bacterium]
MPIYNASGDFLGTLKDVEFQNQTAIRLITDSDISHPFTEVGALSDAIILRKAQPYPLGQIIPHKNVLITRKILRGAVEKQSLIKLTLSLPPFSMR